MPTVLRMPEVLADSTEAAIQTWLVSVGQQIAVGDPLAEIETDKALVEYASEVEGVLAQLIAEPGKAIAVGQPIALVLAPGETEADIDAASDTPAPTATVTTAPARVTLQADPPNSTRIFATPLVRKLAHEHGIDLADVTGSGPAGRIVRRDLERHVAQQVPVTPAAQPCDAVPVPPEAAVPSWSKADGQNTIGTAFIDQPLTGMRRAIARRLTESKTTVPHFYLTADCRVDALMDLRRNVNAETNVNVSVNDLVLKAVAGALTEVPDANAIWNHESIRRFEHVDIAVAVAVDGGLLTPVLRGVDTMSLGSVSTTVTDLVQRARAGRIQQGELEGGSFSVSNLGMRGVTEFSAILNPPHSGILAVGHASERPIVVDGELAVGTVMTVTLSADHRVIDGAIAAEWMAAFVRRIENPLTILV